MDYQTMAFLHAHGIRTSPKMLQKMLEEAIAQLPAQVAIEDAQRELTRAEAQELEEAGFDLRPQVFGKRDPMARAVTQYAAMLDTSLSVKDAAKLLCVNESRVRQRLSRERTLYGIKLGSGWHIPLFQFAGSKLIPSIDKVFPCLSKSLSPVAVLLWFTAPNPDLEPDSPSDNHELCLSPRDWLLQGYSPDVAAKLAEDL